MSLNKNLIWFPFALVALLAAAYLLRGIGVSYFAYPVGLIAVLFLPGASFLTLWPSRWLKKMTLLEAVTHSLFLSVWIVPLVTFLMTKVGIPLNALTSVTLLMVSALVFALVLSFTPGKLEVWRQYFSQWKRYRSYLLGALVVSILAAIILARLEPFLPEYDGWWHLIFGERVKEFGGTAYGGAWSNFRPFFLHWIVNLELSSGIDSYTLTKWVIPVFGIFASLLSLRVYTSENGPIAKRSVWLLLLVLPLLAPLFVSQIIYIRAQYPIMIAAFYFLFLIKRRQIFFNLLGLTLAAVGIMFHEFSLFYLPLFIGALTIRYGKLLVAHWRSFALYAIYLVLLAFAYRGLFLGTILRPFQTVAPFLDQLREEGLRINRHLFFWKDYIGSDHPYQLTNYEILKFYAHHILFLIVLGLGLWLLIRNFRLRRVNRGDSAFRYALFGTLFLLLFIVEGLPRFGVPMDPERPWIFINYFALAIAADVLSTIRWKPKAFSRLATGIFLMAFVSVGITGLLMYKREKRIYATDTPAISFVREKTPINSLIIAPFEKQAPFYFFTGRPLSAAPRLPFWENIVKEDEESSKVLATLQNNFTESRSARVEKIRGMIDDLLETPGLVLERIGPLLAEYRDARAALSQSPQNRQIYLLVSQLPRTAAWTKRGASNDERYRMERDLVLHTGLFTVVFEDSANTLFLYEGPARPLLPLEEAENIERAVQEYLAPLGVSL